MPDRYSLYDAKARFSEVIRKVREGESVLVTYRGEEVAEIRPVVKEKTLEQKLADLRRRGIIGPSAERVGRLEAVAERPGALRRFLDTRD